MQGLFETSVGGNRRFTMLLAWFVSVRFITYGFVISCSSNVVPRCKDVLHNPRYFYQQAWIHLL